MYRKFVVDLGIAGAEHQPAGRDPDVRSPRTPTPAPGSQSGVSLDEEMTNMIAYQRAYEAAAKVMSTIDGTLDTLINSLKR